MSDGEPAPERALQRRILVCFLLIVITFPLMYLGGAWRFVLLPDLMIAAVAFATALQLRRVRRSEPR